MLDKLGGHDLGDFSVMNKTKQTILLHMYIYLIIATNGLNLGRNSISQMVFYLLVKTINQIFSYFINKNDHPSHNSESKSTYQVDKVFFGFFPLKYSIKKPTFVVLE
jgi:hypothetical protein